MAGMRPLARGAPHHRRPAARACGRGGDLRPRQLEGLAGEAMADDAEQLMTIDEGHADLRRELLGVGRVPPIATNSDRWARIAVCTP
jgi:hypothetical protein